MQLSVNRILHFVRRTCPRPLYPPFRLFVLSARVALRRQQRIPPARRFLSSTPQSWANLFKKKMEIELKIRLNSEQTFTTTFDALKQRCGSPLSTTLQENFFLDSPDEILSKQKVVFRVRMSKNPETKEPTKCTITIKGKAVLENGISRVAEREEEISVQDGQLILRDNDKVFELRNRIGLIDEFLKEHPALTSLKLLGTFSTLRHKFQFDKDHKVELDATKYSFGNAWELEVESNDQQIEQVRQEMVEFMKQHKIEWGYSKRNKMVNMMMGSVQ